MITGQKRCDITKEQILARCSEYDILRSFWPKGKELELNIGIKSPFREDNTPSFIVGTKYGYITYKDMGCTKYRGNIWSFVQQMGEYEDFFTTLKAVDTRLQLGICSGNPVEYSPIVTWQQPKISTKIPPLIQVVTRKFNSEELAYWNSFHQDISDLKREMIYVPKEIYVNRKRIPKGDMAFCYFCEDIEKWKIYRPLAGKREKTTPIEKWKWMSNIPFDYLEGKWNIANCDLVILTKSRKDSMVLKKALGINCICNVQAEDPACLPDDTIDFIERNSNRRVICADSDKKGKEFSWWLTSEHEYTHCNVPETYKEEGIKDFADLGKIYGLDAILQHFINKKIL